MTMWVRTIRSGSSMLSWTVSIWRRPGLIGFKRRATGRPGYDPADLLKLYIYGYLNRVRSSRRLEAETHRNIEVIWLLRRLVPDFKTIADFRRENRDAFRQVFRAFVALCRELDLFGRELIAVDGTRLKAVNGRERNFTKAKLDKALKESDERLTRYLKQLDDADQDAGKDDDGFGGGQVDRLQEKIDAIKVRRERLEGHRTELEISGQDQLSLTDPDARAMHGGRVGVGYNVQIAVDAKHKLIAEQQVHAKVSDLGLLAETAEAARETLEVARIDAVADRGYFKIEDIEACEAAGIVPYVPKPKRGSAVRDGFFTKERFRYDTQDDAYTCPGDQRLTAGPKRKVRDGVFVIDYANPAACKGCVLRPGCTKAAFRQGHPVRERSGAGAHGAPIGGTPRGARPATRKRRAPVRLDKAVDGPGGVSDAPLGKRPRRVRPDRLGLQHPPRHHPRRHSSLAQGNPRLNRTICPNISWQSPPKASQTPRESHRGRNRKVRSINPTRAHETPTAQSQPHVSTRSDAPAVLNH